MAVRLSVYEYNLWNDAFSAQTNQTLIPGSLPEINFNQKTAQIKKQCKVVWGNLNETFKEFCISSLKK